jgi:hypothetical protein
MIRIEAPQPATNYRTGNGLLATGYWLLATGYRLPATGNRQPATATGYVTVALQ